MAVKQVLARLLFAALAIVVAADLAIAVSNLGDRGDRHGKSPVIADRGNAPSRGIASHRLDTP